MRSCLQGLHARGFRPEHIVDVGASVGSWSILALAHWPTARYSLFEPLVEHTELLEKLRQGCPNVSWFPYALGSQKGELSLSIYPDQLDAASLAYAGPGSRRIPVETLDGLVAAGQIPPAELLKIDVQGFEREVLRGGGQFLQGVAVAIIETYFFHFAPGMTLFHELVAIMHGHGFRVYEVIDPIARPCDGAVAQCDICFVREGHPLVASNAWA